MHQGGCERWRRVGAEQEAAQVFCVSATDTQSARFTNSAWAGFWALGLHGHRRSKQTKAARARLPRAALAHFDLREGGQGARETQGERLESACFSPDGGDISAVKRLAYRCLHWQRRAGWKGRESRLKARPCAPCHGTFFFVHGTIWKSADVDFEFLKPSNWLAQRRQVDATETSGLDVDKRGTALFSDGVHGDLLTP